MNNILQEIRGDLRRSMNGIVSTSMREKGLNYKLNFGVDAPRLKTIASKYNSDAQLANLLWSQDTRELKILATMLYPVSEFTADDARKWVLEIPNQEIREQLCFNLLQRLDFSSNLAFGWMSSPEDDIRTTGYWLLARLMIANPTIIDNMESLKIVDRAVADLLSDSYFLKLSAQNALKFMGRNSAQLARTILEQIAHLKLSADKALVEVYDSLSFEFE